MPTRPLKDAQNLELDIVIYTHVVHGRQESARTHASRLWAPWPLDTVLCAACRFFQSFLAAEEIQMLRPADRRLQKNHQALEALYKFLLRAMRSALIWMLSCLVAGGHAAVATSGVCEGKQLDGPAIDMLRGKHLQVLELDWPPFAKKDPNSTYGWTGFDIDLFSEVASLLGFTFEVSEARASTRCTPCAPVAPSLTGLMRSWVDTLCHHLRILRVPFSERLAA